MWWWTRRTTLAAVICCAAGTDGFQAAVTRSSRTPPTTTTAAPTNPSRPSLQADRHTTRLEALPSLAAASLAASPLGAISVLASIVLIHEAGHYLAARSFGIAVEEFSVGVGPKILGFKAFGDDFNLRLLPLGGYVRFPENYNVTEVQALEAAAEEEAQKQAEAEEETTAPKAPNPVLNLLSFGALERKRQEAEAAAAAEAAVVEEQPWWKYGGKRGDKKDVQVPDVEIPYYDNPNLLQNRPWTERAVVLSGGVIFNLLLAFSIYFGEISYGAGVPSPIFEPGVIVSAAPRQQGASAGLLRKGDVILNVNGMSLTSSTTPTVFESQRAISELIATIRATTDGEDVQLTVQRDNQATQVVRVQPQRVVSDLGTSGPPSIGVLLSPNYVKSAVLKSSNPIEAAGMAAKYATTITTETANGLLTALGGLFSPTASSGAQVSGPIGLIRTGSEVVATKDSTAVLLFAAALSINLGVVNALPLPALDGGQLLFVLAEAVTGRKIDQRIQEGITGVAVLFLLLVSVGAAVGDLSNLVGR